jgi:hypothetical protein
VIDTEGLVIIQNGMSQRTAVGSKVGDSVGLAVGAAVGYCKESDANGLD